MNEYKVTLEQTTGKTLFRTTFNVKCSSLTQAKKETAHFNGKLFGKVVSVKKAEYKLLRGYGQVQSKAKTTKRMVA